MPKLPRRAAVLALFLAASCATAVKAQVESVTRLTAHPSRFGRLDFVVMLKAEWQDPYHADDIRLDLELTAPSGRSLVVPCFYERGESGASSEWLARYAPGEVGRYRGQVVLMVRGVRQAGVPVAFSVAASGARGFLHAAGPWMFRFDNGEPFRGIGENLCWEARSSDDSKFFKALNEDPRFNYEYLLGRLSAGGGNFFRTWMCPWNLPLEWRHVVDTNRYTDDTARFNASAIRRMDELVDLAGSTDTYFMLTIDPHGAFLGRGWDLNSYNTANGGPVATPAEFFTDPVAKARYKDKLRYLVARWGWSPHLAVWEFFNEIDNAMYGQKPARIPDGVITRWHAEMSAYLKAVDPYGRLVTTSVSHRDVAGMNEIPTMDFSQKHIYRNTASIPATIRQYVLAEGKPYVIGEFAREWDWSQDFNAIAADMDHARALARPLLPHPHPADELVVGILRRAAPDGLARAGPRGERPDDRRRPRRVPGHLLHLVGSRGPPLRGAVREDALCPPRERGSDPGGGRGGAAPRPHRPLHLAGIRHRDRPADAPGAHRPGAQGRGRRYCRPGPLVGPGDRTVSLTPTATGSCACRRTWRRPSSACSRKSTRWPWLEP